MITATKSQWSFEYFFLPKKTEPKFVCTNQIGITSFDTISLRTAPFTKGAGSYRLLHLSASSLLIQGVKGCRDFNLLKFRYDEVRNTI